MIEETESKGHFTHGSRAVSNEFILRAHEFILRASPVTACIRVRKQKVASVRDARADAGKAPTHLVFLTVDGLSYLTVVTLNYPWIGSWLVLFDKIS